MPLYLALTPPELSTVKDYPQNLAYMACHFSPYSSGLINLPADLPIDSILILNDSTPAEGHDPKTVAFQLAEAAEKLQCHGVLLDFERPENPLAGQIAEAILHTLPCPVAVSEKYARTLPCAVFLSAPPPERTLSQWLSPWDGREIWLEAAISAVVMTLTQDGCCVLPTVYNADPLPHRCEVLHCHYKTDILPQKVQFTLHRTPEDLKGLLEEAENLGVTLGVGLYQELGFPF